MSGAYQAGKVFLLKSITEDRHGLIQRLITGGKIHDSCKERCNAAAREVDRRGCSS